MRPLIKKLEQHNENKLWLPKQARTQATLMIIFVTLVFLSVQLFSILTFDTDYCINTLASLNDKTSCTDVMGYKHSIYESEAISTQNSLVAHLSFAIPSFLLLLSFFMLKSNSMTLTTVTIIGPIFATAFSLGLKINPTAGMFSFILPAVFIAHHIKPKHIKTPLAWLFTNVIFTATTLDNLKLITTTLTIVLVVLSVTIITLAQTRHSAMKLNDKLEELSYYDSLTKLKNRHAFEEDYKETQKTTNTLALLVMDLDYFKTINDTCGHPVGDAALIHVGNLIQNNIRKNDEAYRIGGDEMVAILKDCTQEQMEEIAERIVRTVENTPLQYEGHEYPLTISCGVSLNTTHETFKNHYSSADMSLYTAKKDKNDNNLRNRVGETINV